MEQIKPLTLRRNFSWTFAGNAVYAACQWGMLIVLAKLGSPEMIGQFTLGLAVTAPVIMFTNLSLRNVQATDAKYKYQFGDYLGLRLIATSLGLLIILGITIASGYRLQTLLVILTIGLAKGFESISDVFYGLIQQYERMDRIAISMMIKGPLSLLLLAIGVYFTGNVLWGTVGLAVAWAIVLLNYDIRSGALMLKTSPWQRGKQKSTKNFPNPLHPQWNLKTLVQLTWLALPLGVVMMLISLNSNIPRYFIESYLGERELGIFAALAYLMVAGNMVIAALGQSASPRLAKYYVAGNSTAFGTLLFKLVGLGLILGALGVFVTAVAGREILTLLYKSEYAEHSDLFVWLMVAAGMGYVSSFLGYGMTAARYFRVLMPLFALVTATSAIVGLWLIPTQGLSGAAIALILSALVQLVLSLGVTYHAIYKLRRGSYET
ncbi:lipopolysaccharide biosynthesis protein [Floridanema evergladense]|uniref:Lipopolysaccharide biosynthesis protein n=1 Tax=Floridaenema evergladense BLCC-F167 TaxID=3153639 RepID=A0ABV4WMV4_9CYAN